MRNEENCKEYNQHARYALEVERTSKVFVNLDRDSSSTKAKLDHDGAGKLGRVIRHRKVRWIFLRTFKGISMYQLK